MKFSIENIRLKVNEQENKEKDIEGILAKEDIEKNIERFCREVLVNEQEIGYGNYSWVYRDTHENGLCYKKYKPGAEKRMNITAHSEMNFMSSVHGLDSEVKTPYPIGLAEVVVKNNEANRMSLIKVIAMEYFDNATRLEDVVDPKFPELKKELPHSFEHEVFFNKLEDFVKKMHDEKGIYHRDLHSRNVLIDNETGNPIVIDFGDASYPSADDRYDAYGRATYGKEEDDDLDLANVKRMREEVLQHLDKTK